MKPFNYSCVASIAGTDPSGGAGIQADIKAIAATGGYAASIITALVAQNTQGVQGILPIPPEFVQQQMTSVFEDLNIKAVKIGMLHRPEIMEVVGLALEKYKPNYVVLDPVMIAKDGSALLEPSLVGDLKKHLFSRTTLITPNLFEAEHLLHKKISSKIDMEEAAKELGQKFNLNVLVKGGHFDASPEQAADVLFAFEKGQCTWLQEQRIATRHTHGTGCSLSAAIASYLAQDFDLVAAVTAGKAYLTQAIASGSTLQIGKGCGPVDHFWKLRSSCK